MARPKIELNRSEFEDLAALSCDANEICWWFRDKETGKPISRTTLYRWCKRVYGMSFETYIKDVGCAKMKIALRRNQLKLSEKSAAMAIFLGKNILGQKDTPDVTSAAALDKLEHILDVIEKNASD